jgi:CBS domain-containing protein
MDRISMTMVANDVMSRDFVSISPETRIAEIAALMLSRKTGAIPVVDAAGRVVGIVSENDLIHRSELGTEPHYKWWHDLFAGREQHSAEFVKVHGTRAMDVMSSEVVAGQQNTPLADLVDMFDRFHLACVPVVQEGRLTGVVYRRDLLRPLAAMRHSSSSADRSDADIRTELDKLLHEAAWATVSPVSSSVRLEVDGGIVRMIGVVASEAEREALYIATAAIPGVRSVENGLALLPRDISAI